MEESELRDKSFFEHFQIKLVNQKDEIKIINMDEYLNKKGDGEKE